MRRLVATAVCLLALGCEGPQSGLTAKGPSAEPIVMMWWIMAAGAVVIFVAVMTMVLESLRPNSDGRDRFGGTALIVGGGVIFPVVTLTALVIYTLSVGRALTATTAAGALEVEIVGNMWWWEVRYRPDGGGEVVSANELHLPVDRPVDVVVRTNDVIHSFWIPGLGGKIDMVPGHTNRFRFEAGTPGIYRGQCAEYCGLQHTLMAFYVVAHTPAEFAAWLAHEAAPAREPAVPFLRAGRDAFLAAGCGACHTVRGTPAQGRLGPDLTHVGGRLSLGAGTLGNGVGHLAGWIADSQGLKPGNRMPSFNTFDGPTLRSMAAWLESLE